MPRFSNSSTKPRSPLSLNSKVQMYPQPGPNEPLPKKGKRNLATWSLPTPEPIYTTGIQGTDYDPKASDKARVYPSHAGGYRTTSNGLNIAADPWNQDTRWPDDRQN